MPLMQMLPGKKGISLSDVQAKALLQNVDGLSGGLQGKQEIHYDLGNRYKAQKAAFLPWNRSSICGSVIFRKDLSASH